ncbi:MAG: prepilin peptidase [Clostridium sp.]|nr:prepilin peptidase [Clostridium sp.]
MFIWAMFLFLIICLATDLAKRKIYNLVVFIGLMTALMFNLHELGLKDGVLQTLSGFFTGILLLFIPFILGGIGAGDVKMLGMVGAFVGSNLVFQVMLASALSGGIYALVVLVKDKSLSRRMQAIYRVILCKITLRENALLNSPTDCEAEQLTIPYGAAITAGVVIIYLMGSMNNAFPAIAGI